MLNKIRRRDQVVALGTVVVLIAGIILFVRGEIGFRRAKEKHEAVYVAQDVRTAEGVAVKEPERPVVPVEIAKNEPSVIPDSMPEPKQDATRRINEQQQIVARSLRRYEEIVKQIDVLSATLSGYRDAIDVMQQAAESLPVFRWGGQLAVATTHLGLSVQDSIEDLKGLATHSLLRPSHLSYVGTIDLSPPNVDQHRLTREARVVFDRFTQYAGKLRELENAWKEGLDPAYSALEDGLMAELERARERHREIHGPRAEEERFMHNAPVGGSSASSEETSK